MIDLHCHSTQSDGSLLPTELISQAEAIPLTALALTDHDTVAGIPDFLAAGKNSPLCAIPGVEIACTVQGLIMHVVGLYIDCQSPPLLEMLVDIRKKRELRNLAMLERLQDLGCSFTLADVKACGCGKVLGRLHFSRTLVKHGYCKTIKEGFDRFLARGKLAYVPRSLAPAPEALRVIHEAGGVAIWAHPLTTRSLSRTRLMRLCKQLKPAGLDGVETRYSGYTNTQRRNADWIVSELGLLPCGGSDFHGVDIPGVALGFGQGRLSVPDEWLEPIAQLAQSRRK